MTITVEMVDDLVVEEHGREKFPQNSLLCCSLDSQAKLTDAELLHRELIYPEQVPREVSRMFSPFFALTVVCFLQDS